MTDPGKRPVDVRWVEISASLRGPVLFVKLPVERGRQILLILEDIVRKDQYVPQRNYLLGYHDFLLEQTRATFAAGQRSLVYSLPVKEVTLLVEHLKQVEDGDVLGVLECLRKVLEAGLQDNRDVDWISRLEGGPPPNGAERERLERALRALPVGAESIDIDLSELFEDSSEPDTGSCSDQRSNE